MKAFFFWCRGNCSMLSVGICVKFLEQDMSLGIIMFPMNPFLHLVISTVKKHLCIATSQHISACEYKSQGWPMSERDGQNQIERSLSLFGRISFPYYIPNGHIISRKNTNESYSVPLWSLWSHCTCTTRRHTLSPKCLTVFSIQPKHIFQEKCHGDAYALRLGLSTLFKNI